jgi:hypothetical protein
MRAALQISGDSEAHLLGGAYQQFSRHSHGRALPKHNQNMLTGCLLLN